MNDYDCSTVYASRHVAYSRADPIDSFRRALPASERAPALVTRAAPVADTHDSPQPGPSGLAVSRMAVAAPTMISDSDSDSSGCVVVKIAKPPRKRYRDELPPFDEDDVSARERRRARPRDWCVGRTSYSCPPDDRRPLKHGVTSD
ncbi:hypothetical protein MTO96_006722 [Rhipicephalus appendiculatus]